VDGGFKWSSQHLEMKVVSDGYWQASARDPCDAWSDEITGSAGRPGRDVRVRFWEAIDRGISSEEASVAASVSSAVGTRWFRQAGGMTPISLAPISERYLLFREREGNEIPLGDNMGWVKDSSSATRIGRLVLPP